MNSAGALLPFFVLASCCCLLQFSCSFAAEVLPTPRVIEITDIYSTKLEAGTIEKVIDKEPNSDIVVGEDIGTDSRIVFDCTAPYPVQWVYNGDGMPEYSTNTSVIREEYTRPARRTKFSASASLGYHRKLEPQDSGKYTCRSLQDPNLAVFYYLYVGDKFLFTNKGGDTVTFSRSDETVTIPCSVSNPRAAVSLQKSVNGLVQCPLNDSLTFEPTKGFIMKLSHFDDPTGIYVCTAGFNNTFQVAEYSLVSTDPLKLTCRRNEDCSSIEACIGSVCRSPCQNYCGRNADCTAIRHTAKCSCPSGSRGDPYRACYPYQEEQTTPYPQRPTTRPTARPTPPESIQQDPCYPNPCGANSLCSSNNRFISCACQPGYLGQPPRCRAECEYDGDCPYDRACYNYKCRNPCEGACNSFSVRECRVINRKPVCSLCQAGKPCITLKSDIDSTQFDQKIQFIPLKEINQNKSEESVACLPDPCGKNAVCREEIIYNNIYNTTAEVALCECKPNFQGDAYEECILTTASTVHVHNSQESLVMDSPINLLEPVVSTDQSKLKLKTTCTCGKGAMCNSENDCECPVYFEGSPYIECRRRYCTSASDCQPLIKNAVCTFNECHEALKVFVAKRCGNNAISTVIDGKVSCSCPENYSGIPSIECRSNANYKSLEIENTTETETEQTTPCEPNSCGKNAACTPNTNGISVCECKQPFQGNPLVGCELQCTSDADCPDTHACFEKSKTCVDPCEAENQKSYTECGRNANCKVENHTATCYCPADHPFGSPHVHCKEKSWMPDHSYVHQTCDNQEANCGQNAQCHGPKVCKCLPGFYGDPYGKPGCEAGLECNLDTQCPPEKECANGKCLDPCRKKRNSCGLHGGCRAENHQAVCTCKLGSIRNPSGECELVSGALAERISFYRAFEDVE